MASTINICFVFFSAFLIDQCLPSVTDPTAEHNDEQINNNTIDQTSFTRTEHITEPSTESSTEEITDRKPFTKNEFQSCLNAIYKKFGGKMYRYDIAVYAMENITEKSFEENETRYARKYYQMYRPYIYAKYIKSPSRFCGEQAILGNRKRCRNEVYPKFGMIHLRYKKITKVEGILNAFYKVNMELVEHLEFARTFLKLAIKAVELKQATPNPINFCNNEPSQEKLTEDDDDGVDWEKDTYLLKTFSRNGNT